MLDAGRIVDLDINKKARFDIKELQFPLDAQLLSGPRVLVAEHGANKVSERDAQGNILWAKGSKSPLSAKGLLREIPSSPISKALSKWTIPVRRSLSFVPKMMNDL